MNIPGLVGSKFLSVSLPKPSLQQNASSCQGGAKKDTAYLTEVNEVRRFMLDCLVAVGTCKEHAETVADNLLNADYRGQHGHGISRLPMFIDEIKNGICTPDAEPNIEKETSSTALVNGNHGLGPVVGSFCMDLAIKKAKEVGAGLVSAHSSNDSGLVGAYTLHALKNGLIGLGFSNTSPVLAPPRAKQVALGSNPISVGAPGLDDDSFLLDMSTTAVSLGKVEYFHKKGIPLHDGWAYDEEGKVTTDPEIALKAKNLLPLGGDETSSGYKGFGLSLMVEVLCGILSGSDFGPNVRKSTDKRPGNLGQCYIAINPKFFATGFEERLSDFMCSLKNMTPAHKEKPVLVPGDIENDHMALVDKEGGITYIKKQIELIEKLAKELKVKPMKSKAKQPK